MSSTQIFPFSSRNRAEFIIYLGALPWIFILLFAWVFAIGSIWFRLFTFALSWWRFIFWKSSQLVSQSFRTVISCSSKKGYSFPGWIKESNRYWRIPQNAAPWWTTYSYFSLSRLSRQPTFIHNLFWLILWTANISRHYSVRYVLVKHSRWWSNYSLATMNLYFLLPDYILFVVWDSLVSFHLIGIWSP